MMFPSAGIVITMLLAMAAQAEPVEARPTVWECSPDDPAVIGPVTFEEANEFITTSRGEVGPSYKYKITQNSKEGLIAELSFPKEREMGVITLDKKRGRIRWVFHFMNREDDVDLYSRCVRK